MPNGKKDSDEWKIERLERELYGFFQEKLINLTDIDHKTITNERAKRIYGSYFHIPERPINIQKILIELMELKGYLKRNSQQILEIIEKD